MAPILLPGLELSALTDRAAWNYVESVGFSLSPAQLIGLLIPGFFGRGPAFHWGLWPRVEVGYIGVITLVLALLGIFMRRDKLTWLMVGLAALSLAFSLGIYSIVHGWFTWLLPGLEQLRAPARFIFLFDLAVAILAARGLQAITESWTQARRAAFDSVWRFLKAVLLIAIAVGIPVMYAILLLTQMGDHGLFLRASISTIAMVSFILLLAVSMALLYARRREWVSAGVFVVLAIALLFVDVASLGAYQDLSESDPTANFHRPAIIDFLRADPETPYRHQHRYRQSVAAGHGPVARTRGHAGRGQSPDTGLLSRFPRAAGTAARYVRPVQRQIPVGKKDIAWNGTPGNWRSRVIPT